MSHQCQGCEEHSEPGDGDLTQAITAEQRELEPRARVSPLAFVAILFVRLYQRLLSPMLPPSCRYRPTCSQYTLTALRRYGFIRGGWMGFRRILRCHPFRSGGYDPVP